MKKINELVDVEELAELAKNLDEETEKLKEVIENNMSACLADIDPDVLQARIYLVMQQCFLQSWATMKMGIAVYATEHEEDDIEDLLVAMIKIIQGFTEEMARNCELAEIEVQLAEHQFDTLLDELEDDDHE